MTGYRIFTIGHVTSHYECLGRALRDLGTFILSLPSYPNTSTPLSPVLLAAVSMFDGGLSCLLSSVCRRRVYASNRFNGPTKSLPHRFTPFVVSSYDHTNL
jgi:hypothetical protein